MKLESPPQILKSGYGSYGIREEHFWSNLCTLYADLGFAVGTAHIRGGVDLGEPWYQAAKFLTKKRTFFDFVGVAEKLAGLEPSGLAVAPPLPSADTLPAERWASPGQIALVGGSAGGVLVGACLNKELGGPASPAAPPTAIPQTMLALTRKTTPCGDVNPAGER